MGGFGGGAALDLGEDLQREDVERDDDYTKPQPDDESEDELRLLLTQWERLMVTWMALRLGATRRTKRPVRTSANRRRGAEASPSRRTAHSHAARIAASSRPRSRTKRSSNGRS